MVVTTKNKAKKILIIEDEKHIAEALKFNLTMNGHEVIHALNGLQGLNFYAEFKPHLVVVDLMMPEIDGIGVIQEIRKRDLRLPILVISAKDQVKEKVRCLSLGVDDYLSKPFDLEEFLLRVDRLLTRSNWNEPSGEKATDELNNSTLMNDVYDFGFHRVDLKNLKAHCYFHEINSTRKESHDLTLQEIKLLTIFFSSEGKTLTREEILARALGYEKGVSTRTLDNFIVRFRKYFEADPKTPKFFKSVRSVGYLFDRQGNLN